MSARHDPQTTDAMVDLAAQGAGVQLGQRAIWVHAPDTGECLGRFGVLGIDVHRRIADQNRGQCLDCTHGRTTLEDWHRFQASMLQHHGVDLSSVPAPAFVGAADGR